MGFHFQVGIIWSWNMTMVWTVQNFLQGLEDQMDLQAVLILYDKVGLLWMIF